MSISTATATAPPDKYDRQLRVWGPQGQAALSQSTCLVLVRATAAGTETCKNCILPGLHHLHILDDEDCCTAESAASNFFLSSESISTRSTKSRAEVALQFLLELNPDVTGSFHATDDLWDFDFRSHFQQLLQLHPEWKQFLILGSDLELPLLQSLARVCGDLQLPFLTVHAYGLMGMVQIQTLPLWPICNPRGQQSTTTQVATIPDFYLRHPFPLLHDFLEKAVVPLETPLTSFEYGQVPYPILLYYIYHKVWKPKYPDRFKPQTIDEKKEFVQMIYQQYQATVLRHPEVDATDIPHDVPLNVEEAARNAYMAYTERSMPTDHLQSLLDRIGSSATVSSEDCPKLARTLRAVLQFVPAHQGRPPVHGSIPDMTASTVLYIQLQSIYKQQQILDLQSIQSYLQQQDDAFPMPDEDYIRTVCQNIHDLDVLETGTPWLSSSTTDPSLHAAKATEICDELRMVLSEHAEENADESGDVQLPLLWYMGYEACQLFYQREGYRYPGTNGEDDDEPCNLAEDAKALQLYLLEIVQRYRCADHPLIQRTLLHVDSNAYAMELVRQGNGEVHAVASLVGGVAAQEVIKLVTRQYIPMNNTYVYNGMTGTGAVYKV